MMNQNFFILKVPIAIPTPRLDLLPLFPAHSETNIMATVNSFDTLKQAFVTIRISLYVPGTSDQIYLNKIGFMASVCVNEGLV